MKKLAWDLFRIFLWLPTSAQVAVIAAIVSFVGWLIAKWLFWLWNKNDDRGIGHAGRLGRFAREHGFEYQKVPAEPVVREFRWLPIFSSRARCDVEHLLRRRMGDLETCVFLFTREDEDAPGNWKAELFTTVVAFRLGGADFPDLVLQPVPSAGGPDEIVVDADLARYYTIRAPEEHPVRRFFTPGICALFERESDWYVALRGDRAAMWRPLRNETSEMPTYGVAHEEFDPAVARMVVNELDVYIESARVLMESIAAAAGRSVVTAENAAVSRLPKKRAT